MSCEKVSVSVKMYCNNSEIDWSSAFSSCSMSQPRISERCAFFRKSSHLASCQSMHLAYKIINPQPMKLECNAYYDIHYEIIQYFLGSDFSRIYWINKHLFFVTFTSKPSSWRFMPWNWSLFSAIDSITNHKGAFSLGFEWKLTCKWRPSVIPSIRPDMEARLVTVQPRFFNVSCMWINSWTNFIYHVEVQKKTAFKLDYVFNLIFF